MSFENEKRADLANCQTAIKHCRLKSTARVALILTLAFGLISLQSKAGTINEETVRSWASSGRYFREIKIEVSENYFLPLNAPGFTTNPMGMTLVEGAILTNSFYVKYGKAYREPIVQGASDRDFWYLGLNKTNLIIGSKDIRLGGTETNWTRLATLKQERQLREFTQFGLLFIRPDSLRLVNTNFTAIASITSGPIEGNFSTIDAAGIPHEFQYHFKDGQGVNLVFKGSFSILDVQRNEFDCTISREDDGVLAKTVRIRTVSPLTPADDKNSIKNFTPSDFVDYVMSTRVESNGIQYLMLPNGKLQAVAASDKPTIKPISGMVFMVWFVIANALLIFALLKMQKKRLKPANKAKE